MKSFPFLEGHPDSIGVPTAQVEGAVDTGGFVAALSNADRLEQDRLLAAAIGPFVAGFDEVGTGRAVLARDRLGWKRAFFRHGSERPEVGIHLLDMAGTARTEGLSESAVREMFTFRWNVGRETLLAGVEQVLPGQTVRFEGGRGSHVGPYWSLPIAPTEPVRPMEWWADEAEAALHASLEGVLRNSKQPAVLLSGGVDSSLLAAVSLQQRKDIVAISPTWDGLDDPEIERAKAFAEHIGIEHRIMTFSSEDVAEFTPATIKFTGGPLRDFHMMVLAWVFRELGEAGFDLVLHGQAADALFGSGFLRFFNNFAAKRQRIRWLPSGLRATLASGLSGRGPRGAPVEACAFDGRRDHVPTEAATGA